MFDDPKKELQRLQGQLLAAEEPEWEPPEVDPDTALEEVRKMLARDAEPEEEEIPEEVPEKASKNRFAGLLLALILETLVLVVLVAWWVLCR